MGKTGKLLGGAGFGIACLRGHRTGGHPQLGVHAGHHDVEPGQQVLALVERAVVEDVHLDPGQDAERGQFRVEPDIASICFDDVADKGLVDAKANEL